MSKINLTPNASGTGTLTVTSPNTNSDYTLTLPAVTGTFNTSGAVNEVPAGSNTAPSIYFTGDTNTGIYSPGADSIALTEGGVEGLRLNSSGNVQLAGNLGLGATTPTTSGTGITFPATQSASTDANTLDDYEEGTWTPTYYGSSSAGTTTYNSRRGNYTKVGRLVTVNADMSISSATGTGQVNIGGFPFTSATGTQGRCVPMLNNVNWTGGTYLVMYMFESNTVCEVFYIGDDAAWANQNMTNESMDWVFSMTYVAA